MTLWKNEFFLITRAVSFLIHSINPIVLQNDPTSTALRPIAERIMRSDMWTICCIVSMTNVWLECFNSHSCYGIEEWFALISRHFFINVVNILHKYVNATITLKIHCLFNPLQFGRSWSVMVTAECELGNICKNLSLKEPIDHYV